jgi:hypothetical protein
VLTLARVYGLQWNDSLPRWAVNCKKYELLKWLIKCGCPWHIEALVSNLLDCDDLDHLKALRAATGPWPAVKLTTLMNCAAVYNELDTAKWCREQGAVWPDSFFEMDDETLSCDCWSARCVQWATANGSTWLAWRCQYLTPAYYCCDSEGTDVHSDETCPPACDRKHAHEVFKWAHENGCPCTCGAAAVAAAAHV